MRIAWNCIEWRILTFDYSQVDGQLIMIGQDGINSSHSIVFSFNFLLHMPVLNHFENLILRKRIKKPNGSESRHPVWYWQEFAKITQIILLYNIGQETTDWNDMFGQTLKRERRQGSQKVFYDLPFLDSERIGISTGREFIMEQERWSKLCVSTLTFLNLL